MPLEQTTITPKYVNPPKPGKKMGNVKLDDGTVFFCYPGELDKMQAGVSSVVHFERTKFGDNPVNVIKEVEGGNAVPPSQGAAVGSPSLTSPPNTQQNPNRDLHIFICGVVNNAVQAGAIDPGNSESIMQVMAASYDAFTKFWATN